MKLSGGELLVAGLTAAALALCGGRLAGDLLGRGVTVSAQHPPQAAASPERRVYRLDAPVDLNTATLDQLTALDQVGPVRAQAILDYRAENGPFSSVDDLVNVPGVGPATVEALASHVTVS